MVFAMLLSKKGKTSRLHKIFLQINNTKTAISIKKYPRRQDNASKYMKRSINSLKLQETETAME